MNERFPNLRAGLRQLEYRLIGELTPAVRHNLYADLTAAMVFGLFVTGLNFLPVVLRRLGAPPGWIAFYAAQPFIGFILTTFSASLMPRQHGLMRFASTCWFIARGSFVFFAVINDWEGLVALTLLFWAAESFPLPAYTRLMQAIYPASTRGRVMAAVRVGFSLIILAMTPVVGWVLDNAGHQAFYPVAAVSAVMATLLFRRMRVDEAALPPNPPSSTFSVWAIAGQDRRFAWYLIGMVCFGLGFLSSAALQPVVQVDQLRLSYSEIGGLGVVQSTFFLLSYLILGRQIDRNGGLNTLVWVLAAGAVVPLTYMVATDGWMLAPAFAAIGVVNAGLDLCVLSTVIQLSPPERLGDYSGLQTTVFGLRGLVAPFLGVWLVGLGLPYAWAFGLGAVFVGLGVIVVARVRGLTPTTDGA